MAERTGRHCSGAIGLTLKIDGANSGILASVLHSSLIKTGGRPERPIVALTKSARAHRQEPGRSAARCDPKEFFIGQLPRRRIFVPSGGSRRGSSLCKFRVSRHGRKSVPGQNRKSCLTLRLTTNSNLVGCSIARSAALAESGKASSLRFRCSAWARTAPISRH